MRTAAAVGMSILVATCLTLSASPAQNLDAMSKWATAKVIHYHVVGEFTGAAKVLKGKGFEVAGKVTDRVEMDFDWDQLQQKTVADPVFKNFPTKVESVEQLQGCPAAKVNGAYEYFTFQSVRPVAVMFELRGTRALPPGSLPSVKNENDERAKCGEVWLDTPAASEPVTARMQLALGMIIAMPAAAGEMKVTPDGKSIVQTINTDGWIWTMTPTIVR